MVRRAAGGAPKAKPDAKAGANRAARRGPELYSWMQTTGAVLVVNQQCSLVRMSMPVRGGRGAHNVRLLYPAAVRNPFSLALPA